MFSNKITVFDTYVLVNQKYTLQYLVQHFLNRLCLVPHFPMSHFPGIHSIFGVLFCSLATQSM